MNKDVKISVIIPVYNTEKYVEECIKSIIKQTYKNLEIIIINDGSTDSSLNICKRIAEEDNRIILIDGENKGVSHARNKGIKAVTGDYVFFVDSDDYIEEDLLEKLYRETDNSNVDMVITGYSVVFEKNVLSTVKDRKCILYDKKEFLNNFERLAKENLINIQCNKLTKASIVKKYKLDEEYISGEDYLFNLDLLKDCKKIKVSENCGYFYRNNENAVSNRIKANYTNQYELKNLLKRRKIEMEKFLKIGFSEEYVKDFFGKRSFTLINICARNIALSKKTSKEKNAQYKELLKNEELKKIIDKNYICSKKDFVIYIIYKSQIVTLLKIYSKILKLRAKRKE